ncbi:hypothetical protein F5B19DRAFT_454429 [Rostrohypoxylon terebratum]|nr:hypothetical protein F5B19DRAFT_454429 [Rostrohypoxylon terebratum]
MTMAERSVRDLIFEEKPLVESFAKSVHGAAVLAYNVQNTLDDIKDNTKQLFWWTSTLACICIGLFLIAQLSRLRSDLNRMVQYQEVFRRMWEDDRMLDRERIEEERRERSRSRDLRGGVLRTRSRGKGKRPARPTSYGGGIDDDNAYASGSGYQPTARPGPSPFGRQVDDALDSAPPAGPMRDEWVRQLASMTQERRRAHYEQQQPQVEELEDEEEDDDEDEGVYYG